MCGIVGYVGPRQAADILLDGLRSLEYRGYDSAGIAILDNGELTLEKRAGKLRTLEAALEGKKPEGMIGVGHTRWATHGAPNDLNAHPHQDCTGDVVAIHNGIIENYLQLRQDLQRHGHHFASEADTEVIPHLVESYLDEGFDLCEAVRQTVARLEGAAALVVMSKRAPEQLVAARISNAGAVVIGHGDGEMLLASDLPALLRHTRRVSYLADRELACLTATGVHFMKVSGETIEKPVYTVPFDPVSAEKGRYKHFMLKEIAEQPVSILNTIRGRIDLEAPAVHLDGVPFSDAELRGFQRVIVLGMGTSLHAAMIGRQYIERLGGVSCEIDNSSEFRYRQPVIPEKTLVISVSQSGETVDLLAAMNLVAERGVRQLTICNVEGAATTRLADATILTRCGPEISVCSTKTFSASVVALYLFACKLGHARGVLDDGKLRGLLEDLAHLPALVGDLVEQHTQYEELAQDLLDRRDMLFLGRGFQYPIAMEGALKLKELSYIHAEGYPAGEMKHGPIALIDRDMPVVALAPRDSLFEKMLSNIEQVIGRGAPLIAIGTKGDQVLQEKAQRVLWVPVTSDLLTPLLTVIPAQLLAYHIAVQRGCDVDQPRNLAKTVTVE
ncbi:MAG: glutamine--fructose-6-phosphate transaminase (isomerizing) [Dehalococcoidia bacterium]